MHRAHLARISVCRTGLVDRRAHLELDPHLLDVLAEDVADARAHDGLERRRLHADDGDAVALARQRRGALHADEAAADDDDALALALLGLAAAGLDVVDVAQHEDVAEVLEPGQREALGRAARGEHELGVGVLLALRGPDHLLREVHARHLVRHGGDARVVVPLLRAQLHLGRVRDQRLGELGPVDGQVALVADHGHGRGSAVLAEGLQKAEGGAAAAHHDHPLRPGGLAGEGVGPAVGLERGLVGLDVEAVLLLHELVDGERVRCGRVFDVARGDTEAS